MSFHVPITNILNRQTNRTECDITLIFSHYIISTATCEPGENMCDGKCILDEDGDCYEDSKVISIFFTYAYNIPHIGGCLDIYSEFHGSFTNCENMKIQQYPAVHGFPLSLSTHTHIIMQTQKSLVHETVWSIVNTSTYY